MYVEKYVASGNDFIIFHTFHACDRAKLAQELCHRQNGIGADGLIVLLPPCSQSYNFIWQFYNADGSVADMCGNGSRAVALYAYTHNLAPSKLSFLSGAGVIYAEVYDDNNVEVCFGVPKIIKQNLKEYGRESWLINTGVPHLVILDTELDNLTTSQLKHIRDKYNANVNIVCLFQGQLRVRTFERGVEAETFACGTGMAAAFVVACSKRWMAQEGIVIPASNEELYFRFAGEKLFFKGKVQKVCGTIVA